MKGKTIGEYQITEFIGETEHAVVYKGYQPSKDRVVAVKILKPSDTRDPAAVQQFLQQAELAAQLRHPNILPVFDTGQVGGIDYQVSQLVESGSLKGHLGEFHNLDQALALFSGLTEGLDYIHSEGYVHGNLKSGNIFLDEMRRPLLADFGVTQPAGVASPYSSPEQNQGGVVDRRSDVYALGILLYEVLTGQLPSIGVAGSPSAKRPELSQALDQVVLKAIAQNPDQRFQSAGEFHTSLTAALKPVPPPTPTPAPVPTPPPPVIQKKRTNWMAIILGIILIGILIAGLVYLTGEGDPAADAPPSEEEIVEPVETAEEVEQPTVEPPADTVEPPADTEEPPADPGGSNPCSSVGFLAGAVVFGSVMTSYRKRKNN